MRSLKMFLKNNDNNNNNNVHLCYFPGSKYDLSVIKCQSKIEDVDISQKRNA